MAALLDLAPETPRDAAAPTARPRLRLHDQDVDALFEPALWHALAEAVGDCEWWRCARSPELGLSTADAATLRRTLATDGFAAIERPPPWNCDLAGLARVADVLAAHDYPPSFLLAYAAPWTIPAQLAPAVAAATGGDAFTGDVVAIRVEPGGRGFGPHRDRQPEDVAATFRDDGAPRSCTAWVPLRRATPANGCLYVVPKSCDASYDGDGDGDDARDPVKAALGGDAPQYQMVRALPVAAGGVVLLSHRVVHWGGAAAKDHGEAPRVALSMAFADPDVEPALFADGVPTTPPPLDARVALAAAQQIVYAKSDARRPHDLALFHRIFRARAELFAPWLRAKVSERFQWMEFVRKRGG